MRDVEKTIKEVMSKQKYSDNRIKKLFRVLGVEWQRINEILTASYKYVNIIVLSWMVQ